MSLFERLKSNAESVLYKRNTEDSSSEADTEKRFIKNISVYKTEFPKDTEHLMWLKPSILKDVKAYQSGRHSDKDGTPARDAYNKTYISEDKMTAFICVFPPANGGADITKESLLEDLVLEGITYGIDYDLIGQIAENRHYLCMYAVARGTASTDGADGSIVDLFERNEKMVIQVGVDNIIDFEKPILFHRIKKGEAICRIIPPEAGDNGSNIFGWVFTGKNGIPAVIPQGSHTLLSKDKTVLLAEIDGDISFSGGVFSIENRLVIEGNLNDSSENIKFAGDVIVSGSVENHVEIHAEGSVIIGGQVGSAKIYAGGYIYIAKGMNGDGQGLLNARGDALCRVVENTKIAALGNVYATVINKCDITTEGSVYVTGGKGMLVGGTIRAAGSLEAKRIGNQSLCVNTISIGYNTRLNDYLKGFHSKTEEIDKTLDKIKKVKQQLVNNSDLSQERKEILQQMNQQEKLYLGEKNKLDLDRNQFLMSCKNDEKATLKAENISPLTIVTFRGKKLTINKEVDNCKVFYTGSDLRQIEI